MSQSERLRIQVIGLGPGDPALRTVGAQRALDDAARIVLRTRIHPGIDDLQDDPRVSDCDDLYTALPSFDQVYEAVAERVCDLARRTASDLVFAVPGHPRFGERSVALLLARAAAEGIEITVEAAVSALDVVANALPIDPIADEVQVIDAPSLGPVSERAPHGGGLVGFDPRRPLLLGQVYSPAVAAAAKLVLSRFYPDEHAVAIVRAAGVPDTESVDWCALYELDRRPVDHLTSVWVPAMRDLEAYRSPFTLAMIIARLRAPGGCPWDQEQTHASLRAALIEETYEMMDAIDAGEPDDLAEELGDLLLQVALHAQIAEEQGDFSLEDVYEQVNRKLIRRHPHVFADAQAGTPAEVVQTWEGVKAQERATAGKPATTDRHPLDRYPRSMPALRRATAVLQPRKGTRLTSSSAEARFAGGTRLLAVVQDLCQAGIDPERALEEALRRRVDAGTVSAASGVGTGRNEGI